MDRRNGADHDRHLTRQTAVRWFVLGLVMLGLPGCGGCRRGTAKTLEERQKEWEEAKKEREQKPPFEVGGLVCQPYETKPDRPAEPKTAPCYCKPGHWTAVALPAKANHDNFLGSLDTEVTDSNSRAVPLLGMPFTVAGSRSIALPKGQPKILDSVLFMPAGSGPTRIGSRIADRLSGRTLIPGTDNPARMPAYQYHFVVLARFPERYHYLKGLDCIRNPLDVRGSSSDTAAYHVLSLPADRPATVPAYGLFWTSTAYLLWDEAEPGLLGLDQQTAMLDWLHWGGQLIVSGPETLEALRTSFLGPYLPAISAGTRKLAQADVDPLSNAWSVRLAGKDPRPVHPLLLARDWSGVKLTISPERQAQFVPDTGELVAEAKVGRGRIVVTAFSLSAKELLAWVGYDQFFNGCLLGRSGRRFFVNNTGGLGMLQVSWADCPAEPPSEGQPAPPRTGPRPPRPASPGPSPAVAPPDLLEAYDLPQEQWMRLLDPARNCGLRYFTRDQGHRLRPAQPSSPASSTQEWEAQQQGDGWLEYDADLGRVSGGGVACWSDFNPVAGAAREALQNAAEIEIPKPSFVLWVVGGYLVVLVPLNWAFFRLIGRVEWAWVAAPIIALICSVVVIRLARLDIGFARMANEITVVEMQAEYARAHVTRYSALYTSLYTRYDVQFADPGAQVAPFPTATTPSAFRMSFGQDYTPLKYQYGNDVTMQGFFVSSNSTNFLHSEQIIDVGGTLSVRRDQEGRYLLHNQTPYTLRGVGVLWNCPTAAPSAAENADPFSSPGVQAAWVGTLESAAPAALRFAAAPDPLESLWLEQRNRSPITADSFGKGTLHLGRLTQIAQKAADLRPGEMRLVAWMEEPVAGQEIHPAAPQGRSATLVVAHLRYDFEPPHKDVCHRAEVDPDVPNVFRDEETTK